MLVTGATGFIGRRLVPELARRGMTVRAMTRRPEEYDGPGEPVGGDVGDPDLAEPTRSRASTSPSTSCTPSTTPTSSARTPRPRAPSAAPPRPPGCSRSSTWAGSAPTTSDLSAHLRSRREVERLLGEAGVPVTVLRAAIVVGAGGISWELTRQLVKNLPAMVVPKWVATRTQPIAARRRDPLPRRRGRRSPRPRPGLRDRRPRAADLPRDAPGRRRDHDRPPGADRAGAGADAAAVVVLAGAGHRRRRHDRAQPDRLDGHRGRGHRPLASARSSRRADPLRRGGPPRPRRGRDR